MNTAAILQDKLLTYKEVAAIMRCSRVSIWRRVKDGDLKTVQAGGKVLFQQSVIESYLNIQPQGGAQC